MLLLVSLRFSPGRPRCLTCTSLVWDRIAELTSLPIHESRHETSLCHRLCNDRSSVLNRLSRNTNTHEQAARREVDKMGMGLPVARAKGGFRAGQRNGNQNCRGRAVSALR